MTACSPAYYETKLPPYLQRFPTSPDVWSHQPSNLFAMHIVSITAEMEHLQ